jgi:hypothetical protein
MLKHISFNMIIHKDYFVLVEVIPCNRLFWSLLVSATIQDSWIWCISIQDPLVTWNSLNTISPLIHPCIFQWLKQCVKSYCIVFSMNVNYHQHIWWSLGICLTQICNTFSSSHANLTGAKASTQMFVMNKCFISIYNHFRLWPMSKKIQSQL